MKNDNQTRLDIVTTELRMIYYNNYLLEKGVITKREHEEMYIDIISESRKRLGEELEKSHVNKNCQECDTDSSIFIH